jgi:hypothetical protein
MSRTMYVLVAAAIVTAPFVYGADAASERNQARAERAQVEVEKPKTVTLKAVFEATRQDEVIDAVDGVAVGMGAVEVVIARRNTDGKVTMSCVDSEKAARAFFDAPAGKVATRQAKEQ